MIVDTSSRKFRDVRERYLAELEKDVTPQQARIRLSAMAHAMQMALSLPRRDLPNGDAFEVLMRAVAHGLDGDPTRRNYVLEKARIGINMLESSAE